MEQAQKQEKDQRALSEENKSQKYEKTENAMAQQIEVLKNQLVLVDDQLKVRNMEQQSHLAIEQELRNKNDQLLTQSRQVEFLNRQKDEDLMTLKRHIEKTDRDVKQLQWLESQLKVEVANLKQQRLEAEE
jgi:hypothetical protein